MEWNTNRRALASVAPAALLMMARTTSWADLLPEDVIIGTSGDGLIFSDPDEGVLPPGGKAVTFTRTRVPDGSGGFNFVDPFEEIITDFSGLESRGETTNCLMANKPDVFCDSEGGSGKRIKTQITGPTPFDILLRTTPSETYPSVDYFTFGKISNFSGARMTGFTLELLDADGNRMSTLDPSDAVLFNLAATGPGIGGRLPDGLFGEGGQEGEVGFFADGRSNRAGFARTTSTDVLGLGALSNATYVANFGNAFLDDTMVPDGLFWDDNGDPSDEAALVAWNNLAGGGWTYGILATDANIAVRLADLADALGVDVSDLSYAPGGLVPEDIVAAAEANGLFETGAIEDLRNANLNFTITVGQIEAGQFIWRIVPTFAPIVDAAQTTYQFKMAGYLDAAANVPFWDIGNADSYRTAISDILLLNAPEQAVALESIGFGFAPAFSSLGFEGSRNQVATILRGFPLESGQEGVISTQGNSQSWLAGDNLYGFFSLSASRSEYGTSVGSVGYDVDATALSFGLEKRLNGNTSVGVVLGAEDGSADAVNGLGSIDSSGFSIAAFARHNYPEGLALQALVGFQDLSYDSRRFVLGQTASGSTDGDQLFAALQADYMMQTTGGFTFGPTASIEYYDLDVDGFTETGAGPWNLTVGDQSGQIVLGSIGLRGEYTIPGRRGDTRLTGSLEYTSASGDDVTIQSGFVGLPGVSTAVPGLDDDWVDVSLGFETVLSSSTARRTIIQGSYSGSYGSDYDSHRLQLGLSMRF